MSNGRVVQAAIKYGLFSPEEIERIRRAEDKPRQKAWDITDWLTFDELAEYENFWGSDREFFGRRGRLEGLARARYITAQKKAKHPNADTQDEPWVKGDFRIIGGPLATR